MTDEHPSFTCPDCGAVSYNANDIREQYCGRCHTFPETRAIGDRAIVARMADEMERKAEVLQLMLTPSSALQLAAVVQLVLRHPGLSGTNRSAGERFLVGVREYFADCPTVLEILRRGDDPAEDRPFTTQQKEST